MTQCHCIKDTAQSFDIYTESLDCKTLIINDVSNWMVDDNYVIPTKFNVTITTPNKSNLKIELNAASTTVLDKELLNCGACIEDGIYCIKTESCGIIYSRNFAITCTLKCKLDYFISNIGGDKNKLNKALELSNLIDQIEVNTRLGNENTAQELYKIVEREFEKLHCHCSCK